MTPEQVEKVRGELQAIIARAEPERARTLSHEWLFVRVHAEDALAALNGEQEEERWVVERITDGGPWRVWGITPTSKNHVLASGIADEEVARRIARLPALERAAREAVAAIDRNGSAFHDRVIAAAVSNLAAALAAGIIVAEIKPAEAQP